MPDDRIRDGLTAGQATLLARAAQWVPPGGETIQPDDRMVAGELSALGLAKHVWRLGAYELVATPAGRTALADHREREA